MIGIKTHAMTLDISEWHSELKELTTQYRNIGHNWQFTEQQREKTWEYYRANILLVKLIELESECYIDKTTRQYITDTFMPKGSQ